MNQNEEDLIYDDDNKAIKFILNTLPKETKVRINETHIEYVLDVIYEYYDKNELIEEDSTAAVTIDEDAMAEFIRKTVIQDRFDLSFEEIKLILNGEFEYGKSIGIYTEEEEE